jgi:hypothetical protein
LSCSDDMFDASNARLFVIYWPSVFQDNLFHFTRFRSDFTASVSNKTLHLSIRRCRLGIIFCHLSRYLSRLPLPNSRCGVIVRERLK